MSPNSKLNWKIVYDYKWAILLVLVLIGLPLVYWNPGDWIGHVYGKKPVPIKFGSRQGVVGHVAVLQSTHDKTLSVKATFKNPTFNQSKTFDLVFSPFEKKEIGWLENWQLTPGETVELSSDGWRTLIIEIGELH